jgi:hypothetical protein
MLVVTIRSGLLSSNVSTVDIVESTPCVRRRPADRIGSYEAMLALWQYHGLGCGEVQRHRWWSIFGSYSFADVSQSLVDKGHNGMRSGTTNLLIPEKSSDPRSIMTIVSFDLFLDIYNQDRL